MKWSVETDDTQKSPEVNIEEFSLHLVIRRPLATLEGSLELVVNI